MQFGFFFGGGQSDDDNPSFIVILLVSFVVYVVSFFLMMALSRYREFAADRGAAIVTGRPSALAVGAREDLGRGEAAAHSSDLREAERLERMNAFFIVPARVKSVAPDALLDTPADGEADRAPPAARAPLQGTPRLVRPLMGFLDALFGGRAS